MADDNYRRRCISMLIIMVSYANFMFQAQMLMWFMMNTHDSDMGEYAHVTGGGFTQEMTSACITKLLHIIWHVLHTNIPHPVSCCCPAVLWIILLSSILEKCYGREVRIGYRRYWSFYGQHVPGFWEDEVMGLWRRRPLDIENEKYVRTFRFSKSLFWWLYNTYIRGMNDPSDVPLRYPIAGPKRLAICLSFLSTGATYRDIGIMYRVSKQAVHHHVHKIVSSLLVSFVPQNIVLPTSPHEVQATIAGFEAKYRMPMCVGAIDGTHIPILAPARYGNCYYCAYKGFHSLIALCIVNSNEEFICVEPDHPGSVGDAYAWNMSDVKRDFMRNDVMWCPPRVINGVPVEPFLVGDAAFAATPRLMKMFVGSTFNREQHAFNSAHVQCRRLVETAFGKAKARYRVLKDNNINTPSFMCEIILVCFALHNVCQRWSMVVEDVEEEGGDEDIVQDEENVPPNQAWVVRGAIASYLADL